jgi:hypothetical protein
MPSRKRKPDPTPSRSLRELAQEAVMVQDASNLSGVVHGFSRAMTELHDIVFSQPGASTDDLNRHPIAQAWAYKIYDLSRADRCDFNLVMDIAEGRR